MFLLGAVLLSVTFFATAALQTSTPFVLQSVDSKVDVQSTVNQMSSLGEAAESACGGYLDDLLQLNSCFDSIFNYWNAYLRGSLEVQLTCVPDGLLGLTSTTYGNVTHSDMNSRMEYSIEFSGAACP